MTAERYDAFVSYGHGDAEWVQALAENLERLGLHVFLDAWELVAGDLIAVQLERGLAAADAVVFVVSAASVGRGWVNEEFAATLAAAAAGRQRLIPVLAGEVDLPPMVASRLYVDFRHTGDPVDYVAKVGELAAAIRGQPRRARPGPGGAVVAPSRGHPTGSLPGSRLVYLQQERLTSAPDPPGLAGREAEKYGPVFQGGVIQAAIQVPAIPPVALAQLPAPITGFTGRDDELAVLQQLLDPDEPTGALVSAIAGLAGVGKTALAIQAAHAARAHGWYPGGTLFIDLHGYDAQPSQPQQVLDALLRALGIPPEHIPPSVEERTWLYRSVIAQTSDPVLVIADNASSEAQVRPLVPGSGPHRVVVTSRHTLGGLDARLIDLTMLDDAAGVAVLDGALRAARPGDHRIIDDSRVARRLAQACGGLPLALQISAAILKSDPALDASELANELAVESERLETLAYNDGGRPGPQSVAAAFELSYGRLEDAQARLFRLLPVNPGPSVSTATAAILANLPATQIRKLMTALRQAHLVEAAPEASGRWRMHDLLRLFAQRLSDEHALADDREQACDRLLSYYLDMATAADVHLRAVPGAAVPNQFTNRNDALAWLDAERPNLTAAVTVAGTAGRDQIAMQLPIRLAEYFDWRRFDDWLAAATASRDAARRLGDRTNEAVALNSLGVALRHSRRFKDAVAACQDAVAIFREVGDRRGEGIGLNSLGAALRELRQFDEAIAALRAAVTIFGEAGDRRGEGMALNSLGAALRKDRQLDEAIQAHHAAVVILQKVGDRRGEGMVLNSLGAALRKVPQLDEAIKAHHAAAVIFDETGDRHAEADALDDLGVALRETGQYESAIKAHQRAGGLYLETGDPHGYGDTRNNLGIVFFHLERYKKAINACKESVVLYRGVGNLHGEAMALENLGIALRGAHRFDEAIPAFQAAVDILSKTGDKDNLQIAVDLLNATLAAGQA